MAFWGVEVKPGKPFTHKYEDSKGRLHISMATLGLGTATAKSTLQCNVGNRSPVYICSLYPGNAESLQLNLELEEVDQVLFSVIGPRSIHLCGYYLATARNANLIDDSESYGEDIADTETEKSDYSDEDGYDDSFIDDDIVPEASSPSLISKEEEACHDSGPKIKKGSLRRLRKKYQSVESDDDGCGGEKIGEKIIVNDRIRDQIQETDNEDSLPISSIYKNKASGRVLDKEMDVSVVRGAGDASNKNEEDGGNNIFETNLEAGHVLVDSQTHREAVPSKHLVDPCTSLDVGDIKSPKKKKKKKEKEAKSSCNGHSIKLDNVINELKMEDMTRVIVAGGNPPEMDPKKNRSKRKKKEQVNKSDYGYNEEIFQEDKANRDAAGSQNAIHIQYNLFPVQEVKECAISCMGLMVSTFGEHLNAELPACLPVLVVRMGNEITRLTAVKVGICCHCCFSTSGGSVMCSGGCGSRVDCIPLKSKIVFAAPSRPLVMQQIEACHNIVGIPQEWTVDMTGQLSPPKRAQFWKTKRVFFVTPQVLEKDIHSGTCLVKYLVCLVIDEAHRAMGNYAYCEAVRELMAVPVQLRILALTATPGSKQQTVQAVIDNLHISRLEYRSETDHDVMSYVHNRKIELIQVVMGPEAVEINNKFMEAIRPIVARLTNIGVIQNRDYRTLSPCQLLEIGKIFLMSTKMLKGILEFSLLFITSISYFQAME